VAATVDREGRLPIYHQIALNIQRRIASGEWGIGDRLPSEMDLAGFYEVSRVTVRQALTVLEKDGLVERKRPSGTFVIRLPEKLTPTVSIMVDMLQNLDSSGHTNTIHTLSVRLVDKGDPSVREKLGMTADEPFVEFRRLIMVNDAPFATVRTLASSSRFPGLEQQPILRNSLQTTFLTHFGVRTMRAEHWVEALKATDADMEVFGTPENGVVLGLSSLFFDQNDEPMAYMTTRWPADMMRLHLKSAIKEPFVNSGVGEPDDAIEMNRK